MINLLKRYTIGYLNHLCHPALATVICRWCGGDSRDRGRSD